MQEYFYVYIRHVRHGLTIPNVFVYFKRQYNTCNYVKKRDFFKKKTLYPRGRSLLPLLLDDWTGLWSECTNTNQFY